MAHDYGWIEEAQVEDSQCIRQQRAYAAALEQEALKPSPPPVPNTARAEMYAARHMPLHG